MDTETDLETPGYYGHKLTTYTGSFDEVADVIAPVTYQSDDTTFFNDGFGVVYDLTAKSMDLTGVKTAQTIISLAARINKFEDYSGVTPSKLIINQVQYEYLMGSASATMFIAPEPKLVGAIFGIPLEVKTEVPDFYAVPDFHINPSFHSPLPPPPLKKKTPYKKNKTITKKIEEPLDTIITLGA